MFPNTAVLLSRPRQLYGPSRKKASLNSEAFGALSR
jgi:hypothetical protein